ncbi:hypothetical protein [Marinirhabdus gelatinilytica]|uniref:Uncharacterized protein n=1 Tax=Marinirhabdus gelatinilytica TaxID=1703343 RepID=A0A370Q4I3_9FLAO|nr:hypothetical protein [Marinirhabdus gelatinilytica]RDK83257.1 hypothetical protein C8D94_10845 [Marinirhabdus gelatinilytica]
MRKLLLFSLTVVIGYTAYAQVGINTTRPDATLHVDGNLIITDTGGTTLEGESIEATRIVGIDDDGNIVEITTDENLYLENNVLKLVERKKEIGDIPTLLAPVVNNISLIIFPGGSNGGKSIIRVRNLFGDSQITGIDVLLMGGPAAADGTTVWLYPVDGDLTLKSNSILSLPFNRILSENDVVIERYKMVQLLYDGSLQRWVIMSSGN